MAFNLKNAIAGFSNRLLNSMNLRTKILVLYIFVVVIPIIILGVVAEKIMFNFLKTDYSISINEAVDQVVKNVEFRKLTYEILATRTTMDGELAAQLSRVYTDFITQWETICYIDRAFGTVRESLPGMEYFRIYHRNNTLAEDGGILWKPSNRELSGTTEHDWYNNLKASDSSMHWDLYKNPVNGLLYMTLSRKITWVPGDDMLGAVIICVRSAEVFENLLDTSFRGQGDVFLINEKGVIFSSSRKDFVGKNLVETPLQIILRSNSNMNTEMDFEESKYLIISRIISSDWRVAAAIPLKNLEHQTRSLSIWIIAITLGLVILSAVLMLMVINNIVYRLKSLESKMTSVTEGRFNVTVPKSYGDELGDLEKCFNFMAGRLGVLTNEIALVRTREREEALKALQAQINPHFLYNTLGIIRWRALDLNDEELCRIVDAMTVFYRLSLNKGNTILRIRDEIEHIKAYLEIQQYRYMNNVKVKWDIDESVLDYYTIKLILQPIVENSYIHGMVAKRGHGELCISVVRNNDSVVFTIHDNGVGIPDDKLQHILCDTTKSNSQGYGFRNIKERIKLYYGDEGSISISSRWGEGTTVRLKIPVCTEPPALREVNYSA
ncbi:MAG: sensor histidine kinase [Clostridiaceae bacterium]|nr:sensor histidine kinase [Clostridiaceae bacterium]